MISKGEYVLSVNTKIDENTWEWKSRSWAILTDDELHWGLEKLEFQEETSS